MNDSREQDTVGSDDEGAFEEEETKEQHPVKNEESDDMVQQKEVETEIQEQKDFDHFQKAVLTNQRLLNQTK